MEIFKLYIPLNCLQGFKGFKTLDVLGGEVKHSFFFFFMEEKKVKMTNLAHI